MQPVTAGRVGDAVDVSVVSGRRTTIIAIAGELDIATAPQLAERCRRLPAKPGHLILVDAERLEFADAAGLGPLLELRARVTAAGGEISMRHVHGTIARLLDALDLDERLAPRGDAG